MTDTITVVGNIATNPERRAAGAATVTSFRVATSERRLDAQGAWVDAHTNYYSVSAFRSLGENAFISLRRGDRVIVSGRLRLKEWTAADGTKGRSIEIDADAVGHDLRFGTSVFQRSTRSETAANAGEPSGEAASIDSGWSEGSPSDAWAAPGTEPVRHGTEEADAAAATAGEGDDPDEPTDASRHAEHERALALVGADTPF